MERLTVDDVKMRVPRPVWRDLREIKTAMAAELNRSVQFGEVLEKLVERWNQTERLLEDVKAARP